jgi:alkylation response protein AidB-like acyl-CoA dehydrogenase
MFQFDELQPPVLGLTGLDSALSEEERAIQETCHRFAKEVMRPIGEKLDKMTADEVVAPESPLWDFLAQMEETGILDMQGLASLTDDEKARILPIIFEELAWGDAGLSLTMMVAKFPAFAAYRTGNQELIERFGKLRGCWVATQPDRGCDLVDIYKTEGVKDAKHNRGNLLARYDGDEIVINGQSAAWVSATPIAECALAYVPVDDGDGLYYEDGTLKYITVLIPFDLPGVSKGKPLEKMGLRSLCQGEVYFDDVRIPKSYMVANQDQARGDFYGGVTFGNMEMGITFTGLARAAYEHALAYVHERKQGGGLLIEHQSVRTRLFDLFRRVEVCRAIAHRVFAYNYGPNGANLAASITSKTFVTQTAFDVASDALQLFGGNGLTTEYPLEKLLRDARAAMIADGENNLLTLKGGTLISQEYLKNS